MRHFHLIIFGLFILSCNRKDDETPVAPILPDDPTLNFLPSKLITQDQITTFIYDAQNRLIESLVNSSENLYTKKFEVTYNENLVDRVEITYESTDQYSYTNKYWFEYFSNQVIITNVFSDINDYTIKKSDTLKIDSRNYIINGYGINTTYDNNKNLIKIIQEQKQTKRTFDNKNAIFKNVKSPQWLLLYIAQFGYNKSNNPTKIENSLLNENQINSSTISYEYNSNNFPIKQFETDSNFNTIETTIEYISK